MHTNYSFILTLLLKRNSLELIKAYPVTPSWITDAFNLCFANLSILSKLQLTSRYIKSMKQDIPASCSGMAGTACSLLPATPSISF